MIPNLHRVLHGVSDGAQDAMKKGTPVEVFIKGWAVPAAFPGFVAEPVRVKANAETIWAESKR